MILQLALSHFNSLFVKEMKTFFVLINSAVGVGCCFDKWSNWHQSSLTCGKLCEYRTRNILDSDVSFWDAAGGWFSDFVGAEDNCNEDHNVCPNKETQSGSCVYIDCREFSFKIAQFVSDLIATLLK